MTPVSEFCVVPFGQVVVEDAAIGGSLTFAFGVADAQRLQAAFVTAGRPLAIDYEHQRLLGGREDGLAPAAGWIGGLAARGDGLWATNVEWTAKARELLASGQYRYYSPVLAFADRTRSQVLALKQVGLTNQPAMRGVSALAASGLQGRALRYGYGVYGPFALADSVVAAGLSLAERDRIWKEAGGTSHDNTGMKGTSLMSNGSVDTGTVIQDLKYLSGMVLETTQSLGQLVKELSLDGSADARAAIREVAAALPPAFGFALEELASAAADFLRLAERRSGPATGGGLPVAAVAAADRSTALRSDRPVGRGALIAAARKTFAAEVARAQTVICNELAWVNTAFRDRKQPRLTDAEIVALGIETDRPAKPGGVPSDTRDALIVAARTMYNRERENRHTILAGSEKEWLNGTLLSWKKPRLTAAECQQYQIS